MPKKKAAAAAQVDATQVNDGSESMPKPIEPKDKKFKRLANARIPAALKRLQYVGKLANRSVYEYSEEDAKKLLILLEEGLAAVRAKFFQPETTVTVFDGF